MKGKGAQESWQHLRHLMAQEHQEEDPPLQEEAKSDGGKRGPTADGGS